MNNSEKQSNERGRPKNQTLNALHADRQKKSEQIKQYWTQHRITLIAYECEYIHNKKPIEQQQNMASQKPAQTQLKKRKGRKKTSPQFQTGFLYNGKDNKDLSDEINVQQLVKNYSQLNWLFTQAKDPDDLQLRQFMKIMLELKNSEIVYEFLPLYDTIYKEIKKIKFQQIEKQVPRFQILTKIQNKLVQIIHSDQGKFKKFNQYLKNDKKQTIKLLLVEAYCFLAQKFNFNINQYYSEAFSITLQQKNSNGGKKKVKLNEEN